MNEINKVLNAINDYEKALSLLDDYDHQCLKKPKGTLGTYRLTYEECRQIIDSMKFESDVFGVEKDGSFNSSINILETGEAELGFDYIFVNGTESIISVSVEVYDYDGNLLSRFKPVDVPIIRSHLTTVKANFLTSGTGGVTIIPDFDGNFNIEVN